MCVNNEGATTAAVTEVDVRCKYFEIIEEFGIHETNLDPFMVKIAEKYVISTHLPGCGRVNCYGKTATEVCERALAWLEANGWRKSAV